MNDPTIPIESIAPGGNLPSLASTERAQQRAGIVKGLARVAASNRVSEGFVPAKRGEPEQRTVVMGRAAAPQPRRTLSAVVESQHTPAAQTPPVQPVRSAMAPQGKMSGASLAGRVLSGMMKKR